MEVVGLETVPLYAEVASAVELVADGTNEVVVIAGVVFFLSVGVALALVLEVFGAGDVSHFLVGVGCPHIDVLNIFSAKESNLFVSSRVLSWLFMCLLCLVLDLPNLSFIVDEVCLFRSDSLD